MADVIDEFIRRYRKEYDYHEEVSRLVEQQCASDLEAAGIRAIVTHRAKRPDSLLRKLRQRAKAAEERRVREEHSRSDLDDACDKLETLKNLMIDVGSRAVTPDGMGAFSLR